MPTLERRSRDDDRDRDEDRPRRSRDDDDRGRSRDDDDRPRSRRDEEDDRPRRSSRDDDDRDRERSRSRDDDRDERPRRDDRDDRDRDRGRDDRDDRDRDRGRDDDRPRRGRDDDDRPRSSRDDDDRPRGRDREDEDRPRRGRDDDADRPRRGRDDDDAPRRERETGSVRKGWEGSKANRDKSASFAVEFKPDEKEFHLLKFLEDGPSVSYRQHWVETPPKDIKKKSWICVENDCPLCDIGDRPRAMTVFQVIHVDTGGEPENKVLILGPRATTQLENFAKDDQTGPLTRLYWGVKKNDDGSGTNNWRPIKERDVDEDWRIQPLTEEEIEDALRGMYPDEEIYTMPQRSTLRELADYMADRN